jgi:mono/diheme cytochrome c family protein
MKAVFVAAVALVAFAGSSVAAQTPDAKKVEAGKAAFVAQKCGTCHTITGVSTGKLASVLDGVGKKLSDGDVRKWLTNPVELEAKLPKKPAMPMSTWLKTHKQTDPDVEALVAYMMSLK